MSFFQQPAPTRYDINFRLFGFRVQVHPLFWLMTILLGYSTGSLAHILIWIAVVFFSILVHELGHTFMMRLFGLDSMVVLYLGGGLAVPTGSNYRTRWVDTFPDWIQDVLISLAGPFIGFSLAALVVGVVSALGGIVWIDWVARVIPLPRAFLDTNQWINVTIQLLLWVNVFWGLINLLPVFPLDGGRVARQIFRRINPLTGIVNSLWLSVLTGAALAVGGIVFLNSYYMALFVRHSGCAEFSGDTGL